MQISTNYKFTFLCSPKCASTSIEAAVKDMCNINFSKKGELKHINASDYSNHILPLLDKLVPGHSIESFCLIRNPIEWIESWFQFRSRDQISEPSHPNYQNYTGGIKYPEFIESFISSGVRPPYADLPTQSDFMSLSDGSIGVDHIFSMSRLDIVADFLSKKTAANIVFPIRNVSTKRSTYLSNDLEIKLIEHLNMDMKLFGLVEENGGSLKTKGLEFEHLL